MPSIEKPTGRISIAQASAFWILLVAATIGATTVIGRAVEAAADGAATLARSIYDVDGLWQSSTAVARVSSLPDGIYVVLRQPGSAHPLERTYHFRYAGTVGSDVRFVDDDNAANGATWTRGTLLITLPGQGIVLHRP